MRQQGGERRGRFQCRGGVYKNARAHPNHSHMEASGGNEQEVADEATAAEVPLPVNQGGLRIGFSAGFAAEVLPVNQGDTHEGFAAEVLPVDLGDVRKGFAAEVLPVNLGDAREGFAAEVLTTMPSDEGDTTTIPPDEGDGMTIPPDKGDGTAMLPDEGDGTAMPSDEGDTKMISPDEGDTTTTMIKSGFKGKCTNKKFGQYGKRGGDRKRNYTPSDNPTNDNTEQHRQQEIFPTNTGRKVTKKLIIRRLSIVNSTCREAQLQNQLTSLENRLLTKKLSKSKEVVEGLRACLRDARLEMRSTKNNSVKALQCNAALKNDSLSREHEHQSLIAVMEKDAEATLERVKRGHAIGTAKIISNTKSKMAATEKKHKCVVNIITKCERATITAKDNLHALDIEKKDKEISVSLSFDIVALLSSITHNFFVRP